MRLIAGILIGIYGGVFIYILLFEIVDGLLNFSQNSFTGILVGGIAIIISYCALLLEPSVKKLIKEKISLRWFRNIILGLSIVVLFLLEWVGVFFGMIVWVVFAVEYSESSFVSAVFISARFVIFSFTYF
jgi:hypothetical protein